MNEARIPTASWPGGRGRNWRARVRYEPPSLVPASRVSPFGSTLKHDHSDLNEENLNDLNRHKITRSLSETVFGRMAQDAIGTGDFNIADIEGHPDVDETGSTCSESSLLGLKELAEIKALAEERKKQLEQAAETDIASTPDSPRKQQPKLSIKIPTAAFGTPPATRDNSKSQIEDYKEPPKSATDDAEPAEVDLSNQEIEGLLDRMISQHKIDYQRDLAKMEIEDNLSRKSSTSSRTSTKKILRPQGFDGTDSSPITKEIIEKVDWHTYGVYSKPKRMPSSSRSYGSSFTGGSSGMETPVSPPNYLVPKGKNVKALTTIQNNERERQQVINGIAERLIRAGRNRSLSGPPVIEGTGVLDRFSTFKSPPDGASFATIFTVQVPMGHFQAPLTKLGRPVIPDGVATNKYTAVATYHPSYRHLVIDVMEYCFCPAGFDSSLLVDLAYLQNTGYLPSYLTWPIQEHAAKRYQVASEWSMCAIKANGHDVLFVSELDVMVQRIAGAMYRAHEGRTMSKVGHQRFLQSISDGCGEVLEAELTCNAASLVRKPTYGTVCVDYNRSAAIEWMSLTAPPNHQLPHSRDGMPIKLF